MLGRARMFGARLWARMPPQYLTALKAFALQSDVPLAEYVRGMVHDHILQRGAAFRERGAAFGAFINAGKAWIITYHECVAIAGALPGKKGRAELEELTWEAVKKAHEFIQTEEAAKNAKHRIHSARNLVRRSTLRISERNMRLDHARSFLSAPLQPGILYRLASPNLCRQ